MTRFGFTLAMALVLGLVGACEGGTAGSPEAGDRLGGSAKGFGSGGQYLLGEEEPGGDLGGHVSPYLWLASLEAISFMPVASTDPQAGVIITDWYEPPETHHERVKVNLYMVRHELRAGGLRAAVFRQRRNALGNWVDAESGNEMARELIDAILAQALKLWFHQRRDPVEPPGPAARADGAAPEWSRPIGTWIDDWCSSTQRRLC